MSSHPPQSATFQDKEYQYYDIDDGDLTVFFIHGIGTNKDWALHRASHIPGHCRKILLDLPGHNGVPLDGIEDMADIGRYVYGLAEFLQLDKVALVGFSMGGLVTLKCLEACEDHDRLIGAVVWASPVLGMSGIGKHGRSLLSLIGRAPPFLYRTCSREGLMKKTALRYGVDLPDDELKALSNFPRESALKLAPMITDEQYDLDPDIPSLMIYGTNDILVTEKNYQYAKERSGDNVKVELVEDGGHFGTKEGVGESYRLIGDFLEEIGKR